MKYELNLETYDALAYVYDELMDNIPYTEWCDVIDKIIREHGVSRPIERDNTKGLLNELDYADPGEIEQKEMS